MKAEKKFLMICSYLPSAINFRGALLQAIAKQGYAIHIIAPDMMDFPDEVQQLQQLGYTVHHVEMQRTGTNPFNDSKTILKLYQKIKHIQPEMVLAYTIKPVIYGMLAAKMAGVKRRFALITGLGYAFSGVEESGKISSFQKVIFALYAKALSVSSKVFFQNADDLALFQRLKLLKATIPTVVVNGSGVNTAQFDVLPLPKNTDGSTKISFLMIARLLIDKGVREYAQACQIIQSTYPNIECHLVGWLDDNPNSITQQELDSWITDKRLHYWGKLSDVRPAIAQSSVYVLPSYREGTPRTVLEAMAMGRAIITTDTAGCRQTVDQGKNGFLVEVKSVQSLVQAMQKFIQQPDLAVEMGQESRQIAEQKYDVHQVNAHMLKEMI